MDKQFKTYNKNKKDINKKTTFNSKPEPDKAKEIPITEWFYMTPKDVNAKIISDILKSKAFMEADLWEAMNILQITLEGNKTVDFDPVTYQFKDPSDAAFIKNRSIRTIFAVTIEEGALEAFQPILKVIIEELDGFLCADSPIFKPVYELDDL